MTKEYGIIVMVFLTLGCNQVNTQKSDDELTTTVMENVSEPEVEKHYRVDTRIDPPKGYRRSNVEQGSFQQYLRRLRLKSKGSPVRYYDGSVKTNEEVIHSVVDLEIGNEDLHQCADAVMRLRAEYLWEEKRYEEIHFNFTNGHKVEYTEWMNGGIMNVSGNKSWWTQGTERQNTYNEFWKYLELVFMYAGTASLEKELKRVGDGNIEIGDVLIQGGFPGHAVIIVDKAEHVTSGEEVYLLAQSYMPAQEIHVLNNLEMTEISPWYRMNTNEIRTPEWNFMKSDIRRFE